MHFSLLYYQLVILQELILKNSYFVLWLWNLTIKSLKLNYKSDIFPIKNGYVSGNIRISFVITINKGYIYFITLNVKSM